MQIGLSVRKGNKALKQGFQPTRLEGCVLWLDGADGSTMTVDGSNRCSQWNDKSGLGNHVTQGTENDQPVYTLDQQNGLSVLAFDADIMTVNPTGIDFGNPFYVGLVVKTSATDSKKTLVDFNDVLRILHNNQTVTYQIQRPSDATDLGALDDTDFHVFTLYFETDNTVTAYFDTASYTDVTVDDMTANSMATIGIGGRIGGGGAFTGQLAELVVWQPSSAFENAEFIMIRDYLLNKWGIS